MNTLEMRLQSRMDARDHIHAKHEALLRERDGGELSDTDKGQIETYRSELQNLDTEIEALAGDLEAHNKAMERSKALRRSMLGAIDGTDATEDGVVYRTMAAYARDFILTRSSETCSKIATQFGDQAGVEAARARLQLLKRTPDNTLSSNVGGLMPPEHIAQIFQVIDNSRPIVATSRRADLTRGTLTYPQIDTSPQVLVQASEKTEGGTSRLAVSMQTATASTYIGGGDLSWQAINWSTPDALQLWFDLAAADYALKTEQDAAQVMQHSAFTFNATTLLDGTDTYDDWVAAIVSGCAEVYTNSGRLADTLYVAPDAFYAFAGSIPGTVPSAFLSGGLSLAGQTGGFSGLRIVVSRGMDSGVAVVGDSQGLLVAETAGAPVELRVVEPAIGGVEVGIIGAFEAVVVDAGAFAMISTAS